MLGQLSKQKNQHKNFIYKHFFFIVISYNRWNQGAPEDHYIIFYTSSLVLSDTCKGHTLTHTDNDWMHMAHCTWIGIVTKSHHPFILIFFFLHKDRVDQKSSMCGPLSNLFLEKGCDCIISTFFSFLFFINSHLLYKIWNTRNVKIKKNCSFIITITTHTTIDIF